MKFVQEALANNFWPLTTTFVSAAVYLLFGVIAVFKRKDDKVRVALITFLGIPAFLGLLLVSYLVGNVNIFIRGIFILAAILIPPSLFFLFVAARRESLFNAYMANLDRLGLLRRRRLSPLGSEASVRMGDNGEESESSRRRRVKSYLDRFSAVYGTIPPEFIEVFLKTTGDSTSEKGLPEEAMLTPNTQSSFELKTILPIIVAAVLMALGWFATLPPFHVDASGTPDLNPYAGYYKMPWITEVMLPVLTPANFAFLGAYFFSLQMIVRRFVRRDLGPNAYNAVSLRIFLATLGVWVAQQALGDGAKGSEFLVIAFGVGVFPEIAWQFVAGVFKKFPGVGWAMPSLRTGIPLSRIDGLTVWHEARLEEEDIENVPNLATADVVDLFLNTKFPPHRIIDWVDQAILLTYLGDDAEGAGAIDKTPYGEVRKYGLRTATAFVLAWDPSSDGQDWNVALKDLVKGFSEEQQRELRSLAVSIRTNPNFSLMQAWRGLDGGYKPLLSGLHPSPLLGGQKIAVLPTEQPPGPTEPQVPPPRDDRPEATGLKQ